MGDFSYAFYTESVSEDDVIRGKELSLKFRSHFLVSVEEADQQRKDCTGSYLHHLEERKSGVKVFS